MCVFIWQDVRFVVCHWNLRECLDASHMVYWNRNSCKKPLLSKEKAVCVWACVCVYVGVCVCAHVSTSTCAIYNMNILHTMCLHLSFELAGLSRKSSGLGLRKFLELRMGFSLILYTKAVCKFYAFSKCQLWPQFCVCVCCGGGNGGKLVKLNPSFFLNKLQRGGGERYGGNLLFCISDGEPWIPGSRVQILWQDRVAEAALFQDSLSSPVWAVLVVIWSGGRGSDWGDFSGFTLIHLPHHSLIREHTRMSWRLCLRYCHHGCPTSWRHNWAAETTGLDTNGIQNEHLSPRRLESMSFSKFVNIKKHLDTWIL